MRPSAIPDSAEPEIRRMKEAEGLGDGEIAAAYGVSPHTVGRFRRRHGIGRLSNAEGGRRGSQASLAGGNAPLIGRQRGEEVETAFFCPDCDNGYTATLARVALPAAKRAWERVHLMDGCKAAPAVLGLFLATIGLAGCSPEEIARINAAADVEIARSQAAAQTWAAQADAAARTAAAQADASAQTAQAVAWATAAGTVAGLLAVAVVVVVVAIVLAGVVRVWLRARTAERLAYLEIYGALPTGAADLALPDPVVRSWVEQARRTEGRPIIIDGQPAIETAAGRIITMRSR